MMRLNLVDFLKGYSITTIVIFHLFQQFDLPNLLSTAINFGGAGVHVFILCSGFGLLLSHLQHPISYFEFLRKRFSRLYTPYVIVVLISASVPFMYFSDDKIMALLSNIFLFKMFDERYMDSFGGHLWFVSMIFQFYFMFPLIRKLFSFRPAKNILLSVVISISWSTFVFALDRSDVRIYNGFFLQYLWEFVIGMELGRYFFKHKKIALPNMLSLMMLTIIGITITGVTGYLGGTWKLFNDIPSLTGYLSLALIIYSLNLKPLNFLFIYTNKLSYEWYLTHMLIFLGVKYYFPSVNNLYYFTFSLAFSFIFALSYHHFLQRTIFAKNKKTNSTAAAH